MGRIKDLQIRKFNPGTFQSDEEVVAQFKVRHHELQTVLNILHDNIETPSCQHTLILGSRGQGKTMLLTRTAAELRSNEQFSEYLLPVRFMEESLEISNMTEFWLETLFHLARECQQFNPQLGQELHSRHSALSKKWESNSLKDLAQNAVLDAADQLGRKLVLMIENLQMLFEDVDSDFGWELRKALQTEPHIMLLGSATSRFKELDDAKRPFFEFFWIIHLQSLNTIECQKLWSMISGQKIRGREIRPLEILTGGSPRLVVIVASFSQHKSTRQLMEELVLLIDECTDYFRGNLEVLAKTERRVFLAVLDLWQPSTPSEISTRAHMDIRKVSTMLGRLVSRGAVIVEGNGRKRKYAAAERLYSIYYKLRRNRGEAAVVQNLIRFMNAFYTGAERVKIFLTLIDEMDDFMATREGFDRVMTSDPEIAPKLVRIFAAKYPHRIASREARQRKERIIALFDQGDFAKVIQGVDQTLSSQSSDASQFHELSISQMLLLKATAHQKQGNLKHALLIVSEIINRCCSAKNPKLRHFVASALVTKIEILYAQGKEVLALSTVEEIVKNFGDEDVPYLQAYVACALVIKGEILKGQHNLYPALDAFEEAVRRLDAVENREIQWCIARALINKGEILRVHELSESALSAFEEIIERFQTAEISDLHIMVSFAFLHKIMTLCESDETIPNVILPVVEEGIEFTDAIEHARLPTAMHLLLQKNLATMLTLKGYTLRYQGKTGLAKEIFENIMERFGAADDPKLQIQSIKALINLTEIHTNEGNIQDALLTHNEITRRLDKVNGHEKIELTRDTLRLRTKALLIQGDLPSAVDSFRSFYAILEPDNEAMIRMISNLVISLIAVGVIPNTLLNIFSSKDVRGKVMQPVIVALKQENGEPVRAPREILDVATDIRNEIETRRELLSRNGKAIVPSQ